MTLLMMAVAPCAHAQAIYGAIECIEIIPNGYRANFSVESLERNPVLVAIGANNNISPGAQDQGQLTTIYPGFTSRAFRVEVVAAPPAVPANITWNFLAKSYTASLTTPRCRRLTLPAVVPVISIDSGANQLALVNRAFAQPINIKVTLNGRPLRNFVLDIRVPASGASATILPAAPDVITTDLSGIATIFATANATAGRYTITVVGASPVASVTFELTNQ